MGLQHLSDFGTKNRHLNKLGDCSKTSSVATFVINCSTQSINES